MTSERRKFERVLLNKVAKAYVTDAHGKKLGHLRMLGRGGFQVETKRKFVVGDSITALIVDESEDIRREVIGVIRNVAEGKLVGIEFSDLDPDAAVEVGVIIGKYYASAND